MNQFFASFLIEIPENYAPVWEDKKCLNSSAGHVPGLPGTGTEQEHEHVPDLLLEHDYFGTYVPKTLIMFQN